MSALAVLMTMSVVLSGGRGPVRRHDQSPSALFFQVTSTARRRNGRGPLIHNSDTATAFDCGAVSGSWVAENCA